MRIGGVIDHEVDDDAQPALMAAMGELDEVAESAISRIDAVIVGDVVTIVPAWRRLKRHQPDRGDAKTLQVVQAALQAFEVADTVAIGVHVGRDRKAIEHAVFVPEVVDHIAAALLGPPRPRRLLAAVY